tara:strand:- start:797 stop:1060 length:264 start_codon:yes stop_codon:yes gene_type:complete
MRKININKDNKIITKSFISYRELVMFLKKLDLYGVVKYNNLFSSRSQVLLGLPLEYQIADKIWKLDIGISYFHSGYNFSTIFKKERA